MEGRGWKSVSMEMKHVLSMHISANKTLVLVSKLDRTADKGKEMGKQGQSYVEVAMGGAGKREAVLGAMGHLSVLHLKEKGQKGTCKEHHCGKEGWSRHYTRNKGRRSVLCWRS